MARIPAILTSREASPVLESFDVLKSSMVTVTTTAVALPTTNLSNRKAIFIQNLHATNNLFLGGDVPDIFEAPHQFIKKTRLTGDDVGTLYWYKSAGGTSEWYATGASAGDPGLTEPVRMYGVLSAGAAEGLLTNGTVASLNDHEWDWGDGDTLGFNTIYFRDGSGSPENNRNWSVLYGYPTVPDNATNYGIKLGPNDTWWATLSGSARIFGIASAASTTTAILELG